MPKTFTALFAILMSCAISLGADKPSPTVSKVAQEELALEVKRLIRNLASDRLFVRREAEQRLSKLGPAILPHLPPPELISARGLRRTLSQLRLRLQRIKARDSIKPSMVTFSGRQPLAELLAAISVQSGNQIGIDLLPKDVQQRPLDLTAEGEPYWKVLDRVVSEAGLRYQFPKSVGKIQLVVRDAKTAPPDLAVTYAGAFRVAIEAARWREKYADTRLGVSITAEPRLRPLFVKITATDFSGVGDDGQILSPKSPDAQWELPVTGSGSRLLLPIDLVGAKKRVRNLKLSGRVTVTAAAGEEHIRFRELALLQNIVRRRGGVTVTLTDSKSKEREAGRHDAVVRVAVSYDAGGPAFESHRTWIYHNRVYLEDEKGQRIDFPGGQRTSLARDGAVVVEYPFRDLPHSAAAYQFVYVAPTLIVNVPVVFEFKQVDVGVPDSSTQQP